MAMYESEYTQWMRDWLARHPEELAVQKAGRALWWDKQARDDEEVSRFASARVAQKPYCYDVN